MYRCRGSHKISITKGKEQKNAEILKGPMREKAEILKETNLTIHVIFGYLARFRLVIWRVSVWLFGLLLFGVFVSQRLVEFVARPMVACQSKSPLARKDWDFRDFCVK